MVGPLIIQNNLRWFPLLVTAGSGPEHSFSWNLLQGQRTGPVKQEVEPHQGSEWSWRTGT